MNVRSVLLDGLIAIGWLTSVGLAALHERGQLWGGVGRPTASLAATLEGQEQWFGIYYQGEKIGFSSVSMLPEEREGIPGVGLKDRGHLSFNLLGQPQELEITARAFIDADWRLQTFAVTVSSPAYQLTWTGRRQGDELLVTVTTPMQSMTKRVRDPTGNAFVSGLSSWAAFHRLRVGQSGQAWILNPLALNPETVYFHVRRSEMVEGVSALVVESEAGGMTTTSWVTPAGEVLKETSPLGWELRRESQEQAMRRLAGGSVKLDLLSSTSVPIDKPLDHPERIAHLTLLMEGISCDDLSLQRSWQTPLQAERLGDYQRTPPPGPWCVLRLDRPSRTQPQAFVPSPPRRYQQPSPFVQSDDARIMTKAQEIVGAHTEPWDQTVALNRWVFSTLTKRLTVGLPSALDVLVTLTGDCHEHTVLFTALARSVGLSTRMVAGLVSWQGQLYYHAWPEVWIDQWLPTDPTLGQPLADAMHLGLVEAENEHLIALGQFIGKLRIHVLEVESMR